MHGIESTTDFSDNRLLSSKSKLMNQNWVVVNGSTEKYDFDERKTAEFQRLW